MMILSMLEDGKITAEEAVKLIDALEEEEKHFDEERKSKDTSSQKDGYRFDFKDTFNSLEDIGSDIGNALTNMFDGLKDFSSSFGKYNYDTTTTKLEMDLVDIENPSLDLKAINGDINLQPHDSDTLSITVICQYKKGLLAANEPYFDFNNIDGKISFMPKYNSNISIKLDVYIPRKHYDEVKLNTTNGKVYIYELNSRSVNCMTSNSSVVIIKGNMDLADLTTKNGRIEIIETSCDDINSYTTNSSIRLESIKCKNLDAKTGNSKIVLNNIKAVNVVCKTSNSPIDVQGIDSEIISLTTSNGKIFLSEVNTQSAKDINLITSNGSINSEIYKINKGVIFDLETSMGSIDIDIPDLVYTTNKQVNLGLKKIVANSIDYDGNKDHLNFVASTSNGSIKIS